MNIKIALFILGIISSIMIVDGSVPTTYRSFVTDGNGFYKIRNIEVPPVPFTYEDRILNINQGDTILWINDADSATITIVSDQNLWNDKVGQIKVGATINYKFEEPGTYTFHLKGSSMRQTIIVASDGTEPVTKPTETYTPSPTATTDMSTPVSSPTPTQTQTQTPTATPTPTPVSNISQIISTISQVASTTNDTNGTVPTQVSLPINLPVKVTPTTIVSGIVVIISLYMTRKTGKK